MRRVAPAILLLLVAGCGTTPEVPYLVVEEHPELVLVLAEARRDGRLATPALLVHVDAHPDLGTPVLSDSLYAREAESGDEHVVRLRRLLSHCAVDDVIVPAVALDLVSAVAWIPPAWLGEPPREETDEIGSDGGRGRRFRRAIRLDEITVPDRRPLRVVVTGPDGPGRLDAPWVLGVDLDAFACANPHREHTDRPATEEEARRALSSGEILDRGESDEDGVRTISTLVAAPGSVWPRRVDRVEDARTGDVRWVLGWRCLGEATEGFPEHEPAPGEISKAVERLAGMLRDTGPAPSLVVLCRSASSGFVPADRVGEIEETVLASLRRVWPGLVRDRVDR